jgi:hypothetical protein
MVKRVVAKILPFLVSIACIGTFAAAQSRQQPKPTPTPADDTVKIETEEVRVNLIAFDESGNFFPGVTAKDVVITENNILHQPEMVRHVRAHVLIVMDTGGELRSANGTFGMYVRT